MEWKERVNDKVIKFNIEPLEVGFVVTATSSNGGTAEMEFEQLPDKVDVALLFLRNPEFRKMAGYE